MRIISNFKDYYDKIQSFGQDDLRYIRHPKEVDDVYFLFNDNSSHWGKGRGCPFYKMVKIGFCGKVYTGFKFFNENQEPITKFLYGLDKIVELYRIYGWKFEYKTNLWNQNSLYCNYIKTEEGNQTELYLKYFEQHRCPIIVVDRTETIKIEDKPSSGTKTTEIATLNARLNQYDFQQVFGPYDAYQEIFMFMSNMAFPNKPIPKIDDITMAGAKGFNKYSFRKDKQI